ncbi:hypothetical protein IIC44_01125 [Patescibacteria group bacterium]|nr:hypothetical protein [Patescibacteria group bacterium]
MDLEELKNILKKDKGKIIIVENGKPVMIISSYEYDEESKSKQEEVVEPLLRDEDIGSIPGELTIDDLPLQ